MSERYIFNKKLNRRHAMWPWLLLMLTCGLTARMVYAEQEVRLVDPNATNVAVQQHQLTDIEFHRSADGAAKVMVSFDKSGVDAAVVQGEQQVEVLLPGTELAKDQLYKLDVTDFATPVTQLETFQSEEQSRILFSLSEPVTVRQQNNGSVMTLELVPKPKEAQQQGKVSSGFEGAPISLDFQDVPVREVLQIIAQVNGFNLVTTDTVTGNVTVSLSNVPWDQALAMILKIKGLGKREEGNILLIAPAEELAQRETQRLESERQVQELAPLRSKTIQINYAKASDIATILKSEEGGILSERGSVTVDDRTNSVLVRDTAESIREAEVMVKQLDIPVKQVLIESRMVTVRDNVTEELGIRWGFSDQQDSDGVSGSLEGAEAIAGGSIPSLNNRLNVNLPAASGNAAKIGFHIAKLADGTILDLELSALEQENKGEIIASPRITVANQHEAYIEQGTEIPYVQSTSSGATSVEFKKAVLSLKVTPHITPDKRIILDLVVTQDTRGDTVSTSTGPAVAIDTQEIATQVLVENGETVVLGGIFQQNKTNAINKVPLFGDLPVVGGLFRNKQDLAEKRELLIFVTPKVMTDAL
ncbi:Type IV pilus bioproteinis and competence protein PilQ [Saliniradius amylolyticus]|uniref:Type IV pilus bioproteinis and competence protein PilQ n=1 Tax=Saliniradius amylolyticus TaxID=2183582 RepID=A0A2S2E6D0_9ALTE|nr:type IV pilus secretin PilQ family protein [Saliniradius amylolyticus]AWL13201.1 Type IV pilus bioproteinis and competence protein PilQ [Saliniradius amylolyticus]